MNIPYIIVNLYEDVGVHSDVYYISKSSASLKLAGGRVVSRPQELREAVDYLESIVSRHTTMPYYMIEYGTIILRPCKVLLESGEVSDLYAAYFPYDAAVGDQVEVFSLYFDGKIASYRGSGVLVDNSNMVSLSETED